MIYSDVYALADHDFTTAPLFGERRASALRSGYTPDGVIPGYITTARAQVSSLATFLDMAGTPVEMRADEPRISGSSFLSRNLVRNPRGEGLVAGTLGSGGVLPTNWNFSSEGVLTNQFLGRFVVDGVEVVRIRFFGTATGAQHVLSFETSTGIAATPLQTWTSSFYLRVVAAPNPPVSYRNRTIARTSGGTAVAANDFPGTPSPTPDGTLRRYFFTDTLTSDGTIAVVQNSLRFILVTSNTYDFTIDVGWPQMEPGASANANLPALPPVGYLRASTRYSNNPGRLLIERQRTNAITNPRGVGATVGSSTDLPTNWSSVGGPTGGTRTITTYDTRQGITAPGLRLSGTTTSGAWSFDFQTKASASAASPSTSWVGSALVRVVAGNVSDIQNVTLRVMALDASGNIVSLNSLESEDFGPSLTQDWARKTVKIALTNAGTIARITLGVIWRPLYNVATDVTLAFAFPQLELGTEASSLVLPPVGTLASATVGGDVVTLPYSALETDGNRGGTHTMRFVVAEAATQATGVQTLLSLNDGSSNNSIEIFNAVGTSVLSLSRTTAGVTTQSTIGTFTPGAETRLSLRVDGLGTAAASLNNGAVASVTGTPSTFALTTARLGSSLSGAKPMNLELIDWAHVPFVYTDDTLSRL